MDNMIGKKLDGRYEIQEIIGVGGMAIVYKAYDSIDDRIVAVKVLKEEYLTNEDFKWRFKNESKAIAVLSYPNIVKVYDVSLGEKLQYIVMEYVDGITLKEYIDQQHVLTWKEAVHFTVQILLALQHAHERGIVHRDIKPQNIMMLEDGTIKVADFGIARFANSETRTITDKAIGSVHYISPEQARGADTDEKSDIYSVGVMLYEMLTGQLPFESENAVSVAIMQMQKEPKSPREINENIPEGLEDITLHAMQKDPLQRYASATEMLADIDKFKRNPSIHFQYKYFVDDNPTKYVDAINMVKGSPEQAAEKNQPKAKRVSVIPILSGVAAGVLIITLVLIFVVLYNFGFFNPNQKNITVPTFTGLLYDNVTANKNYKNFTFKITNQPYNAKPAGTILKQTPEALSSVKSNVQTEVDVWVSQGLRMVAVPPVANSRQADAQLALTNAGFTYTISPQYNSSIAQGIVISSNPKENTQAEYGSKVTLVVSQGPELVNENVPTNLVGQTYDQNTVSNILQQASLKLGNVTHQWNSGVGVGKIISTNPTGGAQALQNTGVSVVVSSGAEPQKFIGNHLSDALNYLSSNGYTQANGFKVVVSNEVNNNDPTQDSSDYWVVVQTDNASTQEIDITAVPSFSVPASDGLHDVINNIQNAGYKGKIYIIDITGKDVTKTVDTSSNLPVAAITDSKDNQLQGTGVRASDPIYIHLR
jgi:serine/threonine protein kinase